MKNTLAAVTPIVNQTVSRKTNRAELVGTLKRLIGALAATHNLMTLADWKAASLHGILEAELSPHEQEGRIGLSGAQVALPHESSTPPCARREVSRSEPVLRLSFHERAAND